MGLGVQLYTTGSLFFSLLFLCVAFLVIFDIFDEVNEFRGKMDGDLKKFKFYAAGASRTMAGQDNKSLFGGAISI